MHYLSSVYFVNHPLHVSGLFLAHHQKVYCIYTATDMCCAFQLPVQPTDSQLKSTTLSRFCIYAVYLLTMGYKYVRNM